MEGKGEGISERIDTTCAKKHFLCVHCFSPFQET